MELDAIKNDMGNRYILLIFFDGKVFTPQDGKRREDKDNDDLIDLNEDIFTLEDLLIFPTKEMAAREYFRFYDCYDNTNFAVVGLGADCAFNYLFNIFGMLGD